MAQTAVLEKLYDEHAQAVFAYALNLTHNEADARDVLQELFLKLARQPDDTETIRDPRGYLLRLTHNLIIDLFRRRTARERRHDELMQTDEPMFAPASDPDEAAFRHSLAAALAELPEDQRSVVHLKLWEELTFEEISGILGIPANTAASRYRYGLDKLRARLRPLHEELQT